MQLINALLDVAVHKDGQIVHAPANTVVRYAALRVIVRTDLGAAVSGGNHGFALGGNTVQVFLVLHIVQAGTELFHGTVQVLELGALFLALDHDTRRDVGETDGRISGVNALTAGTGCAEEVLADIGRIELDIKFSGFGENGHGGGRCLDAALGFGLGDALDAVHAGFVLHYAVTPSWVLESLKTICL